VTTKAVQKENGMIHVEGLTKYYKDFCAVDQIGFDIRKGEILGLLGPNGAGKTTTLRMLTGFLRPTKGSIRVKEFNIHEHALQIKELMGYLPESAPLYYDMLVYDYLGFVADIRGLDKNSKQSRIAHLSDLCGLGEVMHKPIGVLSKGYRQRVGLAHAMMNDPEILIMDEPTSGLDPNQIVEIRDIIRKIGKEKTVILSTHILSEAEATCDRVVIINRGKIVADDSTEHIKLSASGESLVNLVLQGPGADDVQSLFKRMDGVLFVQASEENKDTLRVGLTCTSATDLRASIYEKIKATDWVLLEFLQETQTLENIFRKLTREN
jgi:ABC-2 type transport system ATP-binding protein